MDRVRKRNSHTQRQTNRQSNILTDKQKHRERDRVREGQRKRKKEKQRVKDGQRETDRQRHTHRQRVREKEKERETESERWTEERKRERKRERERTRQTAGYQNHKPAAKCEGNKEEISRHEIPHRFPNSAQFKNVLAKDHATAKLTPLIPAPAC